jgi:hypothetical protein
MPYDMYVCHTVTLYTFVTVYFTRSDCSSWCTHPCCTCCDNKALVCDLEQWRPLDQTTQWRLDRMPLTWWGVVNMRIDNQAIYLYKNYECDALSFIWHELYAEDIVMHAHTHARTHARTHTRTHEMLNIVAPQVHKPSSSQLSLEICEKRMITECICVL